MMTESGEPSTLTLRSSRRRWALLGSAGVVAVAIAVALALFQPWKLWIDDTVDEAAPAGAVAITAPGPTTDDGTASEASAETVPESTTTQPVAPATNAPDASPTTMAPTTTMVSAIAPPPVATGGPFIGIDHGTTGTAVLLQDATGTHFVRLENLDTTNGPDLFVYLSTNSPDGPEGQFDDDFVNLGRLQGNVGSSNYVVPAGTDLTRYASVVIWCDRFNSAFGAAPLR